MKRPRDNWRLFSSRAPRSWENWFIKVTFGAAETSRKVIFSRRDVRPAVSDILTVILWCIIDHRRGDGAFCPSERRRRRRSRRPHHYVSPRPASRRNARKIETWWRFTRTKTDRLLREFNRLMTACRRWHLVIGGCALLLRVPSSFSLSPAVPLSFSSLSWLASHACNCPVFPCLFAKTNRNANVLLSFSNDC